MQLCLKPCPAGSLLACDLCAGEGLSKMLPLKLDACGHGCTCEHLLLYTLSVKSHLCVLQLYLGDVASFGSRSLRQTAGSTNLVRLWSPPLVCIHKCFTCQIYTNPISDVAANRVYVAALHLLCAAEWPITSWLLTSPQRCLGTAKRTDTVTLPRLRADLIS
jgi:hypothetical protein